MPIIGKPLLVLGSLAGVSAAAAGGYFGTAALDSKFSKQVDSNEGESSLPKDNAGVAPSQIRATPVASDGVSDLQREQGANSEQQPSGVSDSGNGRSS